MSEHKLPDCKIINTLIERVAERKDIVFGFISVLEELRKRVSAEVRFINQLFPEYTPHDEEYHLTSLFHIADRLLGDHIIEQMNCCELFALCLSLYGHDWGMAVNEKEKMYIKTGILPVNYTENDFYFIEYEPENFKSFCEKNRVLIQDEEDIPITVWQDYIRTTHSLRSSERIRKYFDKINGGIADAVARIAEGHCLPIEDIQDIRMYSFDYSLLGENINLRALTIYVRLIDLMDLGEDRTPFVIWKYVSPKNSTSKMEWKKHRALRAITTPPYLTGRIIRIEGNTNDHEVYASLMDLKDYCDNQFRESMDLLSQMMDDSHKLDIYHIDWRITTRNFKPISIKFEFDRSRMFEILGSEIYRGDKKIFLRELLQNSIDAIKTRKEILKKKGVGSEEIGLINIKIEQHDNKSICITWTDDGIGMDEYIVRNYLAIAGKSFYISKDFSDLGIKMDPISRFGIGILSCFMVTNELIIESYREPYAAQSANTKPLRIKIPSIEKQFRIEEINPFTSKVGTTILINIQLEDITDDSKTLNIKTILEYLFEVAGFVEYPIIIETSGSTQIIVHPHTDIQRIRERFPKICNIFKTDLNYPVNQLVHKSDYNKFTTYCTIDNIDIKNDLKLNNIEGCISVVLPKKYEHAVNKLRDINQYEEFNLFDYVHNSKICSIYIANQSKERAFTVQNIYYQGIKINEYRSSEYFSMGYYQNHLPIYLRINIAKCLELETDVSRFKIQEKNKLWDEELYLSYSDYIIQKFQKQIYESSFTKRLQLFGILIDFYRIRLNTLIDKVPSELWGVPIVDSSGIITFKSFKEIKNDYIYEFPADYYWGQTKKLIPKLLCGELNQITIHNWKSNPSILYDTFDQNIRLRNPVLILLREFISYNFVNAKMTFLEPQYFNLLPLSQYILKCTGNEVKTSVTEKDLLQLIISNNFESDERVRAYFNENYGPTFIEFANPFEKYFAYGLSILNINHPITIKIMQVLLNMEIEKDRLDFLESYRQLENLFQSFISAKTYQKLIDDLKNFFELGIKLAFIHIEEINKYLPDEADFIKGTVVDKKIKINYDDGNTFQPNNFKNNINYKFYGQILNI